MSTEVNETLQGALSLALAGATSFDTISGVKNVITSHFRGLKSGAAIRTTDFFNHSFAPDLTLSWPDGTEPSRQVFLRFADNLNVISANVQEDLPTGSVVVGLGSMAQREESAQLSGISRERDTLVLDPGGFEALEASARVEKFDALVPTAVAKGGRGLFDAEKAEAVTTTLHSGIQGATRADAQETGAAASVSESDFAPIQANALEYLLQSLWLGSGASGSDFPGTFSPKNRIGPKELQLLLDTVEIDDLQFWRNLGKDVALRDVIELGSVKFPSNLSRLVRANTDRFLVKVAWVRSEPGKITPPGAPELEWVLEDDLLRLDGPHYSAHFARKKNRVERLAHANPRDGISPETLVERGEGFSVQEITAADGSSRVVFSADDVILDRRTEKLAREFSLEAKIARARASLGSGTHVNIDFEKSTVIAVTSSTPPLGDFASISVQALVDLQPTDRTALAEFLALPAEIVTEAPTLLDLE